MKSIEHIGKPKYMLALLTNLGGEVVKMMVGILDTNNMKGVSM